MDIIYKELKEDHIDKMIQVFLASVHELAIQNYTKEQCLAWAPKMQDENKWKKRLKDFYTIGAFIEDELYAFGNINKEGYLDYLYVHPYLYHRRVAHHILELLEAYAKRCACKHIEVDASLCAKAFFEKHGFIACE